MDDCLGQVIRCIEAMGLEDGTLIAYTSDHGDMLGDLGLWQKFEFYEGSSGVPLLIRIPGRRSGVCSTPIRLVNLCSTPTDMAGVPLVAPNDGVSLRPLLENPQSPRPYGPVFAEYGLSSKEPKYMVRDGDWKYTYWVHDIPELYNLRADPQELNNLAAHPHYAAQLARMHQTLFAWHRPPGSSA